MKQEQTLKEKEEIIIKSEKTSRRWRRPIREFIPPGAHWFRVIPYDDGFIPYDKVDTILYYKENAEIKMYVRTFNTPAELTDLGYLYLESPEIILGNKPVFYSSVYPSTNTNLYSSTFTSKMLSSLTCPTILPSPSAIR